MVFHSGKCPPHATSIYSTPPLAFSAWKLLRIFLARGSKAVCVSNSIENRPRMAKGEQNPRYRYRKRVIMLMNSAHAWLLPRERKISYSAISRLERRVFRLRIGIDKRPLFWSIVNYWHVRSWCFYSIQHLNLVFVNTYNSIRQFFCRFFLENFSSVILHALILVLDIRLDYYTFTCIQCIDYLKLDIYWFLYVGMILNLDIRLNYRIIIYISISNI